jgi:dynein heavy chain
MEEAERIADEIKIERERYRGVAVRGSVLYFVIADLANINFMYQYSLSFFLTLFVLRLDKSKKAENMDERLKILIDDITLSVYNSICRGLFEQDKLLFSFLNTSSIFRRDGYINVDEWNFFLRGSANPKKTTNTVDYIDDSTWYGLLGLEEVHDNFKNLTKSFTDPAEKMTWKTIMREENPEKVPLPVMFSEKLTAF